MAGAEIRLLEIPHAEEMFRLIDRNRASLKRWLPWVDDTASVADSREFIRKSLEQYERHEGLVEGIFYDGRLAGIVSLPRIDWANRSAAVGYWLAEEYQGKGLMTSACRALIDHAFGELGLHRLEIKAATDNAKSQAVARRLGFVREGLERQSTWLYDHYQDMVIFSLLQPEWESRARPR